MRNDLYSLLFQSNIIEFVVECLFIITVDAASYFHQFMIKEKDCYKLTVISHQKQKSFNIALMEYKRLLLYMQQQTDKILQKHCVYTKIYIDNIIIFFNTLAEYFEHFWQVFITFQDCRVVLRSKKSFLEYSSVSLFNQQVNSLSMLTLAEKIRII